MTWAHPENIDLEFGKFANLLNDIGIGSYLEIGSKFGGSLWGTLTRQKRPIKAVSIDLRQARHGDSLDRCADALRGLGHTVLLLTGNSQDWATIALAENEGPYDVVYIDGDHSLEGVTADWQNYGPMGRIVAFHDIIDKNGMHVRYLWDELKQSYPHTEFVFDPGRRKYGIGMLYRWGKAGDAKYQPGNQPKQ